MEGVVRRRSASGGLSDAPHARFHFFPSDTPHPHPHPILFDPDRYIRRPMQPAKKLFRAPDLRTATYADHTRIAAGEDIRPVLLVRDASSHKLGWRRGAAQRMVDITPPSVTGYECAQIYGAGSYAFAPSSGSLRDNATGQLRIVHFLSDTVLNSAQAALAIVDADTQQRARSLSIAYVADTYLALPPLSSSLAASYVYSVATQQWSPVSQTTAFVVPNLLVVDESGRVALVVRQTAAALNVADRTPPVLSGLTALEHDAHSVQLSWVPVTDGRDPAPRLHIAAYAIAPGQQTPQTPPAETVRAGVGAAVKTVVADAKATSTCLLGAGTLGEPQLPEGFAFLICVVAEDASGNLSPVLAATANTPDVTAPTFTYFAAGSAAGNTVPISWTPCVDNTDAAPNLVVAAFTSTQTGLTAAALRATVDLVAAGGSVPGCAGVIALPDARTTASLAFGSGANGEPALAQGTMYYFYAVSFDATGNYSPVRSASAYTLDTTPPTLTSFTAGPAAATAVHLAWSRATDNLDPSPRLHVAAYASPQPGITAAAVIAAVGCASAAVVSDASTATSLDLGSLAQGTAYNIYAVASDASGNTSSVLSATALTLDTTPPLLSALTVVAAAAHTVQLGWPAVSDNVDPSPQLRIAVFSSARTSCTTADVLAAVASPASVGALAAVTVANAAAVTSYTFGSGALGEQPLADGKQYRFFAVATDASGNASAVQTATTVTVDATSPVFSSFSVGAPTASSVPLSWTAVSDNSDAAPDVHFAAYASPQPGITAAAVIAASLDPACASYVLVSDASATTSLVLGSGAHGEAALAQGTAYRIYAVARDASGNTSAVLSATALTLDTTPPILSSLTVVAAAAHTVQLGWPAVSDNVDRAPALHIAAFANARQSCTAADVLAAVVSPASVGALAAVTVADAAAVTSYTFGSGALGEQPLADGKPYRFFAVARDASGNASAVQTAAAVTVDASSPVFTSFSVGSPTASSVPLTWTAVTDNSDAAPDVRIAAYTSPQAGITAATVISGVGCASSVLISDAATTTSIVLGSLAEITTYYIYAVASDTSGNTSAVLTATAVTLDVTPPVLPAPTYAVQGHSITFSGLDSATDNSGRSPSIQIMLTTDPAAPDSGFASLSAGTKTRVYDNLIDNTAYRWRLRATDGSGNRTERTGELTTPDVTPPVAATGFPSGATVSVSQQPASYSFLLAASPSLTDNAPGPIYARLILSDAALDVAALTAARDASSPLAGEQTASQAGSTAPLTTTGLVSSRYWATGMSSWSALDENAPRTVGNIRAHLLATDASGNASRFISAASTPVADISPPAISGFGVTAHHSQYALEAKGLLVEAGSSGALSVIMIVVAEATMPAPLASAAAALALPGVLDETSAKYANNAYVAGTSIQLTLTAARLWNGTQFTSMANAGDTPMRSALVAIDAHGNTAFLVATSPMTLVDMTPPSIVAIGYGPAQMPMSYRFALTVSLSDNRDGPLTAAFVVSDAELNAARLAVAASSAPVASDGQKSRRTQAYLADGQPLAFDLRTDAYWNDAASAYVAITPAAPQLRPYLYAVDESGNVISQSLSASPTAVQDMAALPTVPQDAVASLALNGNTLSFTWSRVAYSGTPASLLVRFSASDAQYIFSAPVPAGSGAGSLTVDATKNYTVEVSAVDTMARASGWVLQTASIGITLGMPSTLSIDPVTGRYAFASQVNYTIASQTGFTATTPAPSAFAALCLFDAAAGTPSTAAIDAAAGGSNVSKTPL